MSARAEHADLGWAVHHVLLACPAGVEDTLRAFYAGALGLVEIPKPPELAKRGGAWFRGGSVELHLGVERGFRPSAKAHPGLLVSDRAALDRLAVRLVAAGAPVRWDDGLLPHYHRFHTEDPVRNRIEPAALRA